MVGSGRLAKVMKQHIGIGTLEKQVVSCPNCGGRATRYCTPHLETDPHSGPKHLICRTECPDCDYLMMMCVTEGELTQVYSPDLSTLEVNRPDIPSLERYCEDHPDALECRIFDD